MEIFLVGGAVRDFLLAKLNGQFLSADDENAYWEKVEKDWVVVGSTPQEMISLNYRPVGKSFPVFLHPETHEEFALARTERKVGKGYTGFECYAEQDVTLEEDLKRRDLTINAIAAPPRFSEINFETIIDPYQGLYDLKNKIFRHVSNAFCEDPVRILRIARLACRFSEFSIHDSTLALMRKMVAEGEVDALIPERVWQEWSRSLKERAPWRWFEILNACRASDKLFPDLNNLILKKVAMNIAVEEGASHLILLSLQLYDLKEAKLLSLVEKYRIPTDFKELVQIVAKYYSYYENLTWQPLALLKLYEVTDAFRRPFRFEQFLITCHYLQAASQVDDTQKQNFLKNTYKNIATINSQELLQQGFKGKEFADEIRKIRLQKIESLL